MAYKSNIEWTDSSWSPIIGCAKTSPGCLNCYAEKFSHRLACMGKEDYKEVVTENGKWNGRVVLRENILEQPLHWTRKPRKIFVNSMSDTFHDSVPREWICKIYNIAVRSQNMRLGHKFIILTKRAKRAVEFFMTAGTLKNIWLGATVCNQTELLDAYRMAYANATIRFLSAEPLLGPIKLIPACEKMDWIICGAETGPGARPMELQWARDLRDQCKDKGIPFFFKRAGNKIATPKDLLVREYPVQ